MGAAIFGDVGTTWFEQGAAPPANIDWTFGYMYASGDPQDDPEGFQWIVDYRLDTAEAAGASIPTVTFYRMLSVGQDHGYSGTEAQIVQQMLTDAGAVRAYLDDFVAVLKILAERETPALLHVEPDSWGFMMWAFDGFDGTSGNPNASAVPVSLRESNHPALSGQSFSDDAGGLGRAMLHLRDRYASRVRMGWHASNFRAGTHPEVVCDLYSSMGDWDVIVTEPPHMNGDGTLAWNTDDEANRDNLEWLRTVSTRTGLPILIWQAYVDVADQYIGAWPQNRKNLSALASHGVAGVLWDPNGNGGDCQYACSDAALLRDALSAYTAAKLEFGEGNPCYR